MRLMNLTLNMLMLGGIKEKNIMSDEAKIYVEISGYINCPDIGYQGDYSGEDLKSEEIIFHPYDEIMDDIPERIGNQGIDAFSNLDEFEYDEDKEDAFLEYIEKIITDRAENGTLEIKKVNLDQYYEGGTFEGWDYIATVNITYNELWSRFTKMSEI